MIAVVCKAGDEHFRLPNGAIADEVSIEHYLEEQKAIRNFYVWSRDSYAMCWYEVLEEFMVSSLFLHNFLMEKEESTRSAQYFFFITS